MPDKEWFWSSVTLTGNETGFGFACLLLVFWSSVTLTGNETHTRLSWGNMAVLEQCHPDW